MSAFCPHGRIRTLCDECSPRRAKREEAGGQLAALIGQRQRTWHALRLECHRRGFAFLQRVHDGGFDADTYYAVYDRPPAGHALRSEEDPRTFNGALWLSFAKMLDLELDGHLVDNYNDDAGLFDRLERMAPDDVRARVQDGRLRIHGGNGTWSHQTRQPDFYRHPACWDIVETLLFGDDGRPPARCTDADVEARIQDAQLAGKLQGQTLTIPMASKLLQVAAPDQWAVYNIRANDGSLGRFGIASRKADTPRAYVEFTQAVREIARGMGAPDLALVDIAFSTAYSSVHGRGLED